MNPSLGIFLKLGSVAAFVAMQVLIKLTEGRIPSGEVVFFRSFFAFPVILAWLAWIHQLSTALKTARPMSHFWRSLVGTGAMGFSFAGLQLLPLPEVTAISFAAPILTVVFAALFLGEKVHAVRIAAVALGMTGVAIVLAPQLSAVSHGNGANASNALGALFVLTAATLAAFAQIILRRMAAVERAATIVLYFTLASTLISLFTIPFGWVMPSRHDAVLLVIAGLFGGVGQGLLTSSYRFADASVVAPFDYVSMLFAIVLGYFLFAEVPTSMTLAGASLIVAGGILIIWRERQLGLDRTRARKARTPT
jgi:drug/metabolite transporter (DMT)-like permease